MADNHCLITGNPVDGFQIIGPFPDGETALEYPNKHALDSDWWIIPMEAPDAE